MLMSSLNSAIILACCLTMRAVNGSFVFPWMGAIKELFVLPRVPETEMIFPLTLPIYNQCKDQ